MSHVDPSDPVWNELGAKIQSVADRVAAERRARIKKVVICTCLAVLLASSVFLAGFGIGHGPVKRAAPSRCHVVLIDTSAAAISWARAPEPFCAFARPEDDVIIVVMVGAAPDDQSGPPNAPSASGGFAWSI